MGKSPDWNVYISSMTGILKGLKISEKGIKNVKNLINIENIDVKKEITCMSWGNEDENEVLMGYSDQSVKIFNLDSRCFIFEEQLDSGEGAINGISKYYGKLLTGTESGEIKLWDINKKIKTENGITINAGGCLERVCHSKSNVNCIATGGKENDLKLWDLETGSTTFTAKNVRPDELQLRVPVWISDITFLPESCKVAVSSRHGFVRLYDPSSSFRRPVVNLHIPDQALTCIAASSREGHVLVGSGTGNMYLVDLRSKGVLLNHYKGFVGGIRQIECSKKEPYIVSVGLDRHVRVHHLNSKQLLFKEYLQSRLTSVLLHSNFTIVETEDKYEEEEVAVKKEEEENEVEVKEEKNNDNVKVIESDEEYEELFNNMETIGEVEKRKSKSQFKKKRKKQKV